MWLGLWLALEGLGLPCAISAPAPLPTAATAQRPPFSLDRSDEDWSAFGATAGEDPWDRFKRLSLGSGEAYLTLAGEVRSVFELYDQHTWGDGPQDDDGYALYRLFASADLHWGQRTRLYTEVRSGVVSGRSGGARPSQDRNTLDVGQLFVGWRSAPEAEPPLEVRVGRQELSYGEGTLLAIRDLNVRRTFDGVKVILRSGSWRIDGLLFRPAAIRPGTFDDGFDTSQTLVGAWAVRSLPRHGFGKRLDVYYLGHERDHAKFRQGTARERRHTLGVNLHGQRGPFTSFTEVDGQFGQFGDGGIRAWKVAERLTWSLPALRGRPVLKLQGAVSSGDRDPAAADLQTFHPLFPRGLYYGRLDSSGSLNAIVVHPEVSLTLSPAFSLSASTFWFRRQSNRDGLYSQPGFLLRDGAGTAAHAVGRLHELSLRWQLDRHSVVEVLAAAYKVGPFLRQSSPSGRNLHFFTLGWQYKF
jgi:hypothetical protein